MAISWGSYESSGSLGMRVGLDVSVEGGISHGEAGCTITVEYYTQNIHSWGDDQSLNLGGAIGGSIGYHNGQGEGVTKRGERSYVYDYGPNEYVTNAQRSFSATVNGAFNGITPSRTVTVNIPDRPFAAPVAPSNASVSRINDESNRITWNNRPSAGEPYKGIRVERYIYGYGGFDGWPWSKAASLGEGTEAWHDSAAVPNRKYTYRVQAWNSAGESGFDQTGQLWTTPATPTGCTRTQVGTDQKIDWVSNVNYPEHETRVFVCIDGVWSTTPIHIAGPADAGQTWTHVIPAPEVGKKYKYRVRARTTEGTVLESSYSGETTESLGTTSPPSAPSNLAPDSNTVLDPTAPIVLSWKHNPTDGTAQTGYSVQYREVGAPAWTTVSGTKATSTHTLSVALGYSKTIEWQVSTTSAGGTSPYSALAFFVTQSATPIKYPLYLDLTSGRIEASSTGAGGGGSGYATPAHLHRYRSAGHSFPASATEPLQFEVVDSEFGGQVSYNNTGGVFTFNAEGVFHISCGLIFQQHPTGRRLLTAIHSRLAGIGSDGQGSTGTGTDTTCELSFGFHMLAGDTLYFTGSQNSGTALAAAIGRSNYWCRITRIDAERGPVGPTGPAGATQTLSHTHTQASPLATWVIDHPLSFRPNVTVVDSSGRQVEGDVVYTDADTVTIGFSGAFAGTAYLS